MKRQLALLLYLATIVAIAIVLTSCGTTTHKISYDGQPDFDELISEGDVLLVLGITW
jgi:hypothetical protein